MKEVLIVDDSVCMRHFLKILLEKNGFNVVGEAENGFLGVVKYKELHPDIIIMDVAMPEMDGISSLKILKEYHPDAKVIMVSGMAHYNMVKDILMLGSRFIKKPFEEEIIIDAVSSI